MTVCEKIVGLLSIPVCSLTHVDGICTLNHVLRPKQPCVIPIFNKKWSMFYTAARNGTSTDRCSGSGQGGVVRVREALSLGKDAHLHGYGS